MKHMPKFDFCTLAQMEQICDLTGRPRRQTPFNLAELEDMYLYEMKMHKQPGKYEIIEVTDRIGNPAYKARNHYFTTSARPMRAMALAGLMIQTISKHEQP